MCVERGRFGLRGPDREEKQRQQGGFGALLVCFMSYLLGGFPDSVAHAAPGFNHIGRALPWKYTRIGRRAYGLYQVSALRAQLHSGG